MPLDRIARSTTIYNAVLYSLGLALQGTKIKPRRMPRIRKDQNPTMLDRLSVCASQKVMATIICQCSSTSYK